MSTIAVSPVPVGQAGHLFPHVDKEVGLLEWTSRNRQPWVKGLDVDGVVKFYKSKSDGYWWTRDTAGHGGSAFKVYEQTGKGLIWRKDADEYGHFLEDKWKGGTGRFIPWKDLRGVK